MSEKSDTFKLVNAVELTKEARVGMELTYFDVVALIDDLREENANLTARIAELTECIGSQMADVYTLKAHIAELEMKIRHNALWQASEDAEERAHLEKLVPDLKKRIAELEKAYRWISTTENPPPEDKRFVLAVNATNGKTYYFVLPDLNDSSDNAG